MLVHYWFTQTRNIVEVLRSRSLVWKTDNTLAGPNNVHTGRHLAFSRQKLPIFKLYNAHVDSHWQQDLCLLDFLNSQNSDIRDNLISGPIRLTFLLATTISKIDGWATLMVWGYSYLLLVFLSMGWKMAASSFVDGLHVPCVILSFFWGGGELHPSQCMGRCCYHWWRAPEHDLRVFLDAYLRSTLCHPSWGWFCSGNCCCRISL